MSLDLAPALRDALIGCIPIVAELTEWNGEPSVHTRRPLPADALYPCAAIGPDIGLADADALNSERPIITRDILFYGNQPDDYRKVERMAYAARGLFHRQRFAITPPEGFSVISIVAHGPVPAPTSSDKIVGRVVTLTIRLGSV